MSKNKAMNSAGKNNLKNLEVRIDAFGNIVTSVEQEQINNFLNENVKDRKLEHLHGEILDE